MSETAAHRSESDEPNPDDRAFGIWLNTEPGSRLSFLLRIPVAGEAPLLLACAVDWPFGKDAYCHPIESWPRGSRLIEEVQVERCRRSGKAVHLVLARRQRRRSMFVWTESRGRTLIFWRTPATMATARPGLKVPQARGLDARLSIAVDLRERYPWRFTRQKGVCERRELPVGDYGVFHGDSLWAVVERKTPGNLANDAVNGKLGFALAELEHAPYACLVVEGRLTDVLKAPKDNVQPGWLMSVLAALQAEHPRVPWVYADTRTIAEDYAFRWLAAAVKLRTAPGNVAPPTPSRTARDKPASVTPGEAGPLGAYQLPLSVNDRAFRQGKAMDQARGGRVWSTAEYSEQFGVSRRTAWQELKQLTDAGSLIAEGGRRNRRYRVA